MLHPASVPLKPLVVDLDGTLLRSDMLIESVFARLGRNPGAIFSMIDALWRGKAVLKHRVAAGFEFDPATLPYDDSVLAEIRSAIDAGRSVYLASASNERIVSAIADHLALFSGWFASDAGNNLSAESKAQLLVQNFGERGFDYIGNSAADLPTWAHADKRFGIRTRDGVARRLALIDPEAAHLSSEQASLKTWLRLLRVHQYAKNALVFVALFTAHAYTFAAFRDTLLAAIAFSLCASSVYMLNDLVDLAADRAHPTKRCRPFAAGTIPLVQGMIAVPVLFAAALAIASQVSLPFVAVLLGYFALTTAYSFYLKRKLLIDVVVLASLYTVRVLGGAVAVGVTMSEWLLAFSMFIFTALALIKRYIELAPGVKEFRPAPANRGYRAADVEIIPALAAGAGFNAVTVFALYIASDAVHKLYRYPQLLWLACPILMYWIGRTLLVAHRGQMDDDPIVFALKDRVSFIALLSIGLIVLAANW